MGSVRIIGDGRAGGSFAGAFLRIGWTVHPILTRDDDPADAAAGVDLLLLAVPDAAVATVAASVKREPTTVVAHVAGSLGLEPLAGHWRRAVLHPLVSLTDPANGEAELTSGAWFGLSTEGDPLAAEVVGQLRGEPVLIAEGDWVRYHAAAAIAANHLVGLLGQAERVALSVGVPLEAYLELAAGAFRNVVAHGPAQALTGPVARGDWATVEAHLAALPDDERAAYQAGVDLCRRLVETPDNPF